MCIRDRSKVLVGNPDIRAVLGTQNGTGYARVAVRGPVSYTHLDVYKRQTRSWSAWLMAYMCPPSLWTHRRPLSLRSSAAMTATV